MNKLAETAKICIKKRKCPDCKNKKCGHEWIQIKHKNGVMYIKK